MSLHSTHSRSHYVITVDESELRPEKCGQRMQILKKNHPPNKTLRPEHVVKCSRFKGGLYSEKSRWDPIWIYHGVLSTQQDIYCSASYTDCSRRTGPTMAHPYWPSFSWAHLAFHSQSVPASAVSDETWGQLIGLHKDPYGDTWCSIVHLLLTPKSRILLCRATLVSLTLLPIMDVFLFSVVQ